MPRLKIEVFEGGTPSATITIASWLVVGASKMLPKIAGKNLQEHIDIEQVAALANDANANGVILDIEDHEDKERVVISVVADSPKSAQA
jgi:hypothetical protein